MVSRIDIEFAVTSNQADLSLKFNDWPYGVDPNIVHLVVWVKFAFDEDPETGDLTPEHRRLIEQYVSKTFTGEHDRAQVNERIPSSGEGLTTNSDSLVEELESIEVCACGRALPRPAIQA